MKLLKKRSTNLKSKEQEGTPQNAAQVDQRKTCGAKRQISLEIFLKLCSKIACFAPQVFWFRADALVRTHTTVQRFDESRKSQRDLMWKVYQIPSARTTLLLLRFSGKHTQQWIPTKLAAAQIAPP
jgi:hypothetical protein